MNLTSNDLQIKVLSSLEKIFPTDPFPSEEEITEFTVFHNQRLSFQVAICNQRSSMNVKKIPVSVSGPLSDYVSIRQVISVPVMYPASLANYDDCYLDTKPGLYPDLLRPLHYQNSIPLPYGQTQSLWITMDVPNEFAHGVYTGTVHLGDLVEKTVTVRILEEKLPPQELIHTEWFYADCLSEYYRVQPFSNAHWRIIGSFLDTAIQNGINMILMPLFTPPLDTAIGGERKTTQLLDITVTAPDTYCFDFAKVDKWIDLCLSKGISYFEIPHLFTQWGAKNAPKIVGKVNGRTKKLFGWSTYALGDEYKSFLHQMLSALVDFLKKKGVYQNTFFHISDEPKIQDLEHYCNCKEIVKSYLDDSRIIDALSDYDFYEKGVLSKPVAGIGHIQPFLDHRVQGLWAYYCGAGGCKSGTNRYLSMPLHRVRILGVQLYCAQIEGFLHWGYNFYYNQYSHNAINPFLHTDGEYFAPAGDAFLVYPGDDGAAWESLRLNAMREAMEDLRTLMLCEEKIGREQTLALIREVCGGEVTFDTIPSKDFLPNLRKKIMTRIVK